MTRFTLSGILNFFTAKDLVFESSGESSFKLDFSERGLQEKVYSGQSSSRGISRVILLFILFLFSNFLAAQTIVIDGQTNEWSGNINVVH